MDKNVETVLDRISDVGARNTYQRLEQHYAEVQNLSRNFLHSIENIKANINKTEQTINYITFLKNYNETRKQYVNAKTAEKNAEKYSVEERAAIAAKNAAKIELNQKLADHEEAINIFYKHLLTYQGKIQKILGFDLKTVLVWQGKGSQSDIVVLELDEQDIIRFIGESFGDGNKKVSLFKTQLSSSGEIQMSFNITKKVLTNLKKELKENKINYKETKLSTKDSLKEEKIRHLENTYREVLRRFDIASKVTSAANEEEKKKPKEKRKTYSKYIMYELNNQWNKVKVSSKGYVTEVFTSELLRLQNTNNNRDFYDKSLEINVQTFLNKVLETGNRSGFLMEDYSYDQLDGNNEMKTIQNGIKSVGAQLLRGNTIIEFAQEVSEKNLNNADVQDKIYKLLKQTNVNTATEITDDIEQTIWDKIQKGL